MIRACLIHAELPGCGAPLRGHAGIGPRSGEALAAVLLVAVLLLAVGCRTTAPPVFPRISPALVWPLSPDAARIRYVGELRGESSLKAPVRGLDAWRAALVGPKPEVAFSRPVAVAVSGEVVFVADTGLGVVHRLDLAARSYALLRGNEEDVLRVPIDLCLIPGELLLVADRGRGVVDVFGLDGDWRSTERWPAILTPVALAWQPGERHLWIVDSTAHACFCVSETWTIQRCIGQRGVSPGAFNYPRAVAWHPALGLAVVDAMNFRVQVLDPIGVAQLSFGEKGDAAGDFSNPRGIAVDSDGHFHVVDNQFENVQIFDPEGRLLLAYGEGGGGPGQFSLPAGITIDDKDRIWIADSLNSRVQVFQYLPEKVACSD